MYWLLTATLSGGRGASGVAQRKQQQKEEEREGSLNASHDRNSSCHRVDKVTRTKQTYASPVGAGGLFYASHAEVVSKLFASWVNAACAGGERGGEHATGEYSSTAWPAA